MITSRHFSKSARLRDLLLYVSERVLREGATEIHEQEVGHHVFGREPDYDTASDNTVRVHASTLRKRLERYFATDGEFEPIVIELPKGNYAPLFRERATLIAKDSLSDDIPVTLHSPGPRRLVFSWIAVVLAGATLATVVWVVFLRKTPAVGSDLFAGKPTVQQFWSTIFRPAQITDLVLDDAAIGLYQELSGRSISLFDYYDRSYLRRLDAPTGSKLDPNVAGQLVLKRQSSFANISAVWRVGEVAAALGSGGKLTFARDYSFQSLKSNNAVLFGNGRVNPWIEPFESSIGIRWQFDPAAQGYYPVDTWAATAAREKFHSTTEKRDGQDGYALVALLQNLRGNGRVLLLSATGGSALAVASDFLTNESSMKQLRSRLAGANGEFPAFEALLRTNRDRTVQGISIEVCRSVRRPTEPLKVP